MAWSKPWLAVAFVAVFVGGAVRSLLRELSTPLLPAPWPQLPTLLINVAACSAIDWLYAVRDRLHEHVVHLAAVGALDHGRIGAFPVDAVLGIVGQAMAAVELEIAPLDKAVAAIHRVDDAQR